MIAIFHPPSRYDSTGGEGGIRTPGTRIRGTHDFQSCTFNRSVTSPVWIFKGFRALPCAIFGQCLQNVSRELFRGVLVTLSQTYHKDLPGAKTKREIVARYTIETPVMKKTFALWRT